MSVFLSAPLKHEAETSSGLQKERKATTTMSKPKEEPSNEAKPKSEDSTSKDEADILDSTVFRLTQGLPKRELQMMISEADACEASLLKDIELLEKALEGKEEDEQALNLILESSLTPLDRYWTVSALVGRSRGDMALPSILTVDGPTNVPTPASTSNEAALLEMTKNPEYSRQHESSAQILATWKKINSNKAAVVFKRPVKPEEAPGYTDRIVFPMDLSLIRKMIVTRRIKSYAQLHQYIGLISHNCLKYNGRETDYGEVAREFEAMADEAILQAVMNAGRGTPRSGGAPTPVFSAAPGGAPPLASAPASAAAAPSITTPTPPKETSKS